MAQTREVGTLEAFPGTVFALEFSPDGKRLVAAGTSVTRDGQTRSGAIKSWIRE